MITPAYNLNNWTFLENDINMVFRRIDKLYEIELKNSQVSIISNVAYDTSQFAWGEDSAKTFNKMVAEVKSIHKDMYSIVEALYKNLEDTPREVRELEKRYDQFKLFRLLNNKFKHFDITNKEFDEINVIHTALPDKGVLEVWCLFMKDGNLVNQMLYHHFVVLFIRILYDYKIISF